MVKHDAAQAVAESQLQRLDDRLEADTEDRSEPADAREVDPDTYGFHVDDPELDLLDDDLDAGLRDDVEADTLDVIADAFNARDLDALLESVATDGEVPGLLGYDRDNLPEAVEQLWASRPNVSLTRGRSGTEYVGVLWEHDGERWYRIAVVHVDDVIDGAAGVVEVSEDADLLEAVIADEPDAELQQGARWAEWDEGDGD